MSQVTQAAPLVIEANPQSEYDQLAQYAEGRDAHFYLRSGPAVARILEAGLFVYSVSLRLGERVERAIIYKHAISQVRLGPVLPASARKASKIPHDRLERDVLREFVADGLNLLFMRFYDRHETLFRFVDLGPYSYVCDVKGKSEWLRTLVNKAAIDYIVFGRTVALPNLPIDTVAPVW